MVIRGGDGAKVQTQSREKEKKKKHNSFVGQRGVINMVMLHCVCVSFSSRRNEKKQKNKKQSHPKKKIKKNDLT